MKYKLIPLILSIFLLLFVGCTSSDTIPPLPSADPAFLTPVKLPSEQAFSLTPETSGPQELTGIDQLIAESLVIVEVCIEECDYSWSQSIRCARYKCTIEQEFTNNLDSISRENGYFYLYHPLYENAWITGESYIFFLLGNVNYNWPHAVYNPFLEQGLWGTRDEDTVTLYQNRRNEEKIYSCSISDFEAFVANYGQKAPLEINEFASAAEAAEYADDVFLVRVNSITDGYNDYVRKYNMTVETVYKTGTNILEGESFDRLCPVSDNISVGDVVLIMYETLPRGIHFTFSYDYSFTGDAEAIAEIDSLYGKAE